MSCSVTLTSEPRLQDVEGDWHEFESKALRREKEKQEREARKARDRDRAAASREKEKGKGKDQEKKRAPPTHEAQPDNKRPHLDGRSPNLTKSSEPATAASGEAAPDISSGN